MARARKVAVGRLVGMLAALVFALALVIAIELSVGVGKSASIPPSMKRTEEYAVQLLTARALPPASAFESVSSRSLFMPGRGNLLLVRSKVTPGDEPELVSATPLNATLLAIILRGDQKVALLRLEAIQETRVTALGQTLEDWILVDIDPDSVDLRRGHATMRLYLKDIDLADE